MTTARPLWRTLRRFPAADDAEQHAAGVVRHRQRYLSRPDDRRRCARRGLDLFSGDVFLHLLHYRARRRFVRADRTSLGRARNRQSESHRRNHADAHLDRCRRHCRRRRTVCARSHDCAGDASQRARCRHRLCPHHDDHDAGDVHLRAGHVDDARCRRYRHAAMGACGLDRDRTGRHTRVDQGMVRVASAWRRQRRRRLGDLVDRDAAVARFVYAANGSSVGARRRILPRYGVRAGAARQGAAHRIAHRDPARRDVARRNRSARHRQPVSDPMRPPRMARSIRY